MQGFFVLDQNVMQRPALLDFLRQNPQANLVLPDTAPGRDEQERAMGAHLPPQSRAASGPRLAVLHVAVGTGSP
jgi:hypothetical protein